MKNYFNKISLIIALSVLFSGTSLLTAAEWKPSKQAQERKTDAYKAAHKEINLNIAGILPELYKSIAPGDEIYEDLKKGYNNMHIRMKNEGDNFWRISKGVIYIVKKDTQTGQYIMNLKKPVRENEWLNFSKPVVVRILIKTKFDNYFVVEEIRSPDLLEQPFWFNRYSSTEENEQKTPKTTPVQETQPLSSEQKSSLPNNESAPLKANPAMSQPATTEQENLQSPNPVSVHSLMGYTGATVEITVSGIPIAVKEKLAEAGDEIPQKKGMATVIFRVKNSDSKRYMMNKGFKGKITETVSGYELDVKGLVHESTNIQLNKPIEALFSIKTKNKKYIWTTFSGTIADFTAPIILNNYTDQEGN